MFFEGVQQTLDLDWFSEPALGLIWAFGVHSAPSIVPS